MQTTELDEWAARLLFAQLRAMGVLREPGVWESTAVCMARAGVLPKYGRWWDLNCVPILQTHGYVDCEQGRLRVRDDVGPADVKPGKDGLLDECLRKLPEILTGRANAKEILFPNGSTDRVEQVHREHAAADYFHSQLVGVVERYVRKRMERDPSATIRLVEVGSRTASMVLPRLAPHAERIREYSCTHVSKSGLTYGQDPIRHEYPFVKYRAFDVERPVAEQGIEIGAYDLAIASNVLHATANISKTVGNAKALLKRNGLLVLNEITEKSVFSALTFGLLDGWCGHEDEGIRIPGSPMLDSASWRLALEKEGFRALVLPAGSHRGQAIIVAESDGLITQGNGKPAVREHVEKRVVPVQGRKSLAEHVSATILNALCETLKVTEANIDQDVPFADYGVDSILGGTFVQKVSEDLGITLNFAVLFDHTNIQRLTRYICESYAGKMARAETPRAEQPVAMETSKGGEIAIIGMSGQFPGAADVNAFWDNLINGRDAVGEFPPHYLNQGKFFSPERMPGKTYCKWGGVLEGREFFDPLFFNIAPRDAETMSPHQRLVLQESWKAIEDAGYNPKSFAGSQTGIFIGEEPAEYSDETFIGSSNAIIASRLSYFLNLNGPALVVNTGCSASATAIHLACESLRSRESDVALAGGVLALIDQPALIKLSQIEMLSHSGRCRTFDEAGDGMVLSEGLGMVVLKRLEEAVADGDSIYGVIVASGMNQDGASNGITAPSGSAQEKLITSIYRRYGINPEEITYFETHGTGTRLGDPVEANALVRAFRQFTARKQFCAIGSAKAHIGHTAAAAGVISLIKVLLSMKHRRIPGLLHFRRLNPLIEFEESAFFINRQASEWRRASDRPLMAALNSFGHSGTNVHMVIREHVSSEREPQVARGPKPIPLSAKTEKELRAQVEQLRGLLEKETVDFTSLAYTLQVGREAMEHRVVFVARDARELIGDLRGFLHGEPPAVGELPELAASWRRGAVVDWTSLYGRETPRRISLPTYPFAKERYWARSSGTTVEPEPMTELMTFEEVWTESPMPAATCEAGIHTLVCLLSNPEKQRAFREEIRRLAPAVQVRFAAEKYEPEELGNADAIVNLLPLENPDCVGDPSYLFSLLQTAHATSSMPKRIVSAGPFTNGLDRCYVESWIGFERSLGIVLPGTKMATVYQEVGGLDTELALRDWVRKLWTELGSDDFRSVWYEGERRTVAGIRPTQPVAGKETRIKQGGTYLLTGGCGGLGLLLAEHLAKKYAGNVILTGRSAPSSELLARIQAVARPGGDVSYLQADVCDEGAMKRGLEAAKQRMGPIHGVIHLAGVEGKRSLVGRSLDEFRGVLSPKMQGTVVLDEILKDEPLDFVCYFSSSAAILGDLGSCDYAIGNRFQMAYASYRNGLVAAGQRRGKTLVVNWPLWRDGGMGVADVDAVEFYLRSSGQRFLEAAEGVALFERLLSDERSQHLVLAGRADHVHRFLGITPAAHSCERPTPPAPRRKRSAALKGMSVEDCARWELKEAVVELLKVPKDRLDAAANLADFGFDSIGLAEFARALTRRFGVEITPSLFFGHSTLEKLTEYLVAKHADELNVLYREEKVHMASPATPVHAPRRQFVDGGGGHAAAEPIAIIGMSGRFPQARDVGEMWQILAAGKNAVEEIEADHFDWRRVYGDPAQEPGKTNCKWCGSIPGVSEFDALFFEISPRDAENMDPRQRHLLQEAWNALEDAAYGERQIASQRIGVFVGVEEGDYQVRVKKEERMVSNHDAILAARLSYFLNLRGPVLAINTACSSSLVAAHQACLSLRAGECDTALAAGVNLMLDPDRFVIMTQAGILSGSGRCAAFDRRADGMVPGEAAAVVVLKRLSRAVEDGDPIHAVIRGSGINYDGRTNGITAPSGVAQAELLREVYRRAGVRPEEIEYVVAHGTGTKLGDPVELNALREVFNESTAKQGYCAVTSTKTNFGHTFAASGLVSLIGLVQSLRHEQIPPSLHIEEENEFVDWRESPLFVNREARAWPRQTGTRRLGAVSSFGMSGTNAHVVVEEAGSESRRQGPPGPSLLVFSAKTEEGLRQRIAAMAQTLEEGQFEGLEAVSYTLLEGRHHFRFRCAMVVEDVSDAIHVLKHAGDEKRPNVFQGRVARDFAGQKSIQGYVDELQKQPSGSTELLALAEFYCTGYALNGALLFGGRSVRRANLPTYPFARDSYWIREAPASPETFLYVPGWKEIAPPERKVYEKRLCLNLEAGPESIEERFRLYAIQTVEAIQTAAAGTLIQLVIRGEGETQLFRGLKGILKTARLENPKIATQLIELGEEESAEQVRALLEGDAGCPDIHILHQGGRRLTPTWRRRSVQAGSVLPWKDGGIYLITGGAGALGSMVAREIAGQTKNATLILIGRSSLTAEKRALLESIRARGAAVDYRQVDVAAADEVAALMRSLERLDGIIHCAGSHRDNYIFNKSAAEMNEVLSAKVAGSVNLDRASQEMALDFVVFFSSVAGVAGNVGQVDYAAANAFLDAYAGYRNALVKAGKRRGATVSINWGLWRDGGMRVDEAVEAMMREKAGMVAMDSRSGMLALRQALAAGTSQVVVAAGDPESMERYLCGAVSRAKVETVSATDPKRLKDEVLRRLTELFCELTQLRTDQVDGEEPLESYGLDSFLVNRLNQKLGSVLEGVSRTVFYEFRTLDAVAGHFVEEYPAQCMEWTGVAGMPEPVAVPRAARESQGRRSEMPVAIVGMSGRFPGAGTLAEFWRNLKAGKKSITEMPETRWPVDEFYHPDQKQAAVLRKSCSKWGGLVDGFDQFDPLFFGITPRDAENMDPQERLFLQESWKALEDAGYAPSQLTPVQRQRSGVFAGVTKLGFSLLGPETQTHLPSTSFASVANRVSHHLNLQGASMPIDTMCSSALVAVHEACEYLRSGRGELAIAGAVNLYLHPSTYVGLSARQLLSNTANSAAFSAAANGFVPGEGVGVVVLKTLDRAVADGDDIYGLIRGAAVNHDGKTNSYGTPNPNQQATVIEEALEQSGLDPASITYIEAAASGSAMGDALEMSGLIQAFGARAGDRQGYRLGSVKPNVGHGESVSGMAQLAKVILSMRHRTLVPTLVDGELNGNIDFERLPFELQTTVSEWKRMAVDGAEVPRRAGITSVGAGGVNAHVIVEEYASDRSQLESAGAAPVVFTLSAKDPNRLRDYARQWIAYLEENRPELLASIAYTLQVGREAMACRLAIVARDTNELALRLKEWHGGRGGSDCFCTELNTREVKLDPARVRGALESSSLQELASLWTTGNVVAWTELYRGSKPLRTNGLPTYPFAQRTCWPGVEREEPENKAAEFYALWAKDAEREFREEYLTFCPFEQRVSGFSMSRVFLNPERYPEEMALLQSKQIEMRQVLFGEVDFGRVSAVLDIGCGHGTDVIQMAAQYPHLRVDGFTITRAQADLGNARIAERGLSGLARIHHADSSKDGFPGTYDLIIGIEVTFHIRNKRGLYENVARALAENGRVLLMDFIGNLRGAIADPRVEISVPTRAEWVDLLSDAGFVIERIIDVSPQIANFLYDPEIEQSVAGLPKVAQDTYRNYTNQAMSLEKGWISYCLIELSSNRAASLEERCERNRRMLAHPTSYPQALQAMRAEGSRSGYPRSTEATRAPNAGLTVVLEEVFSRALGFSREELQQATFEELGIGSVNAVELIEAINVRLDLHLPTSLVFEYATFRALAAHIESEWKQRPAEPTTAAVREVAPPTERALREDIAIIGMSCRCAGAKDADEFWRLVSEGKDAIREIDDPSWLEFFQRHSPAPVPARYGAMDDLGLFDAEFFNISPKEAEAIDPAQRILLEESYRALEDAGCPASRLRGQAVGTFIGTAGASTPISDYSHFSMLGMDTSILAARIAYHLDLKGPALAVNTACSSSLVAIDLACQGLKAGQIDLAIAGGITLYTHPGAFLCMNNARMLSPSGECRPFDNRANGIVVGDGAGVVVLKRLRDAERDHDQIYGVIRGSGTNQDGQTSGITVPSFLSQHRLEESVYRDNQVTVEDIQYIETHGTATKLGDPIEMHALQHCFEKFTDKKQFCAVGSVKANIGHTTAAAGVLGLIKVLLSLRAKKMAPSIHFEVANEHIEFGRSPFFVNRTLCEWPENSKGSRLAAVSSFGFSGTNAHLVIEEHSPTGSVPAAGQRPVVIVLSAKREDRLRETAIALRDWVRQNRGATDLRAVAYTLQEGREAFEERLAMVVSSVDELLEKLERFLQTPDRADIYRGQVKQNVDDTQVLPAEEDPRQVAQAWVRGVAVHWSDLYRDAMPHKISLPTYRYLRKKYSARKAVPLGSAEPRLHPLVQKNTSDLKEIRFSSWLDGEEFFLADHIVGGERILPGVAYLEMARAAVTRVCGEVDGGARWQFRNIAWVQPIAINGHARQVHIRLARNGDEAIHYGIYTSSEGADAVLHGQGTAVPLRGGEKPRLDLEALKQRCERRVENAGGFYQGARAKGLELGPSFRAIEEVFTGSGQVLARLSVPACVGDRGNEFVLHPSLMDAALQAAGALQEGQNEGLRLPFALQSLEIFGRSPTRGWVWIRPAVGVSEEAQRLDFDVCDEEGRVRVTMKGLSARTLHRSPTSARPLFERLIERLAKEGGGSEPPSIRTPHRAEMEEYLAKLLQSGLRAVDCCEPYARWQQESFNLLRAAGVPESSEGLDSLWRGWDESKIRWNEDPNLRVQVALVEATLRALPQILAGNKQATDVIFPKSSMSLVEGIYGGNVVADYFNDRLVRAVVGYVQERIAEDPGARIRILEIGAGTGGTTAAILPKLRPFEANLETYCYTDVSVAFLNHAKRQYAPGAPYLTTRLFDVSKPPEEQEMPRGHYDLAIAANVLHATRDIRQTLRNAKATMPKHGLLLLNELTANSLFSHLTFGLLAGWWLYEDPDLRIPGCPGLTVSSWADVLKAEGFQGVAFLSRGAEELGQQIIAAESDGRIREPKRSSSPARAPRKRETGSLDVTDQMVEQHVRGVLRERIAEALLMDEADIRDDRSFSEYGVDSIIAVELVGQVNKECGIELPTTVLFDYNNLDRLTRHIVNENQAVLRGLLGDREEAPVTAEQPATIAKTQVMAEKLPSTGKKEPIAVIGMSGRFARSETPKEFWEHLAAGTDLVERVTRWELAESYAEGWSSGRDCQYGSFVSNIDKFDSLFFNISGVEAKYSDPQQRLFLEEAWRALEDAGYAGEGVRDKRCGVYVGCAAGDYPRLFTTPPPAQAFWGNSCSVVPARIAYYLDLKGPAISVDTACSSSLVSIHLACQGLWAHDTELALAGGVFLQSTPEFFKMANQAGMLSPSGRCHTFDEQADGFVPGEGVGVFMLKRLSEAVAGGDHIYGVIRGSGLNQDGSSNGITAPSAKSQESLEREIYDEFGVHPESIQMVEGHGTGTTLGDPIEFQALRRAFESYTDRKGYCALGSVKTNIGHAATAAGAAGFMKVLLALYNKAIPPSLHFQKANPALDFAESPFFVNTTLKRWDVEPNGVRRAAISGFGFGGTNAHLVVEEAPVMERRHADRPGYLIVLSARTPDQLRLQVENLLQFSEAESELDLGNTSFTLLVGREHRSHRLACVVRSRKELIAYFEKWLKKGKHAGIYVKEVLEGDFREQASLKRFGNQCIKACRAPEDTTEYLENLSTLADLYVQGYRLGYGELFGDGYSRIPLPTYPFARDYCWVDGGEASPKPAGRPAVLHPLVHRNTSDFDRVRFTSSFTGDEFFLADHRVKGSKVLPGVAYLELARAAVELVGGAVPGVELTNIVWARPISVNGRERDVHVELSREENGRIRYEIYTSADDESPLLHSQGEAVGTAGDAAPEVDLATLRAACDRKEFTPEECYGAYQRVGIDYGPGHRGIEAVYAGDGLVIARLLLPPSVAGTRNQFVLHPSILDSALQASIGLTLRQAPAAGELFVPYALESLKTYGPCEAESWAVIRTRVDGPGSKIQKLDIDICDGQGRVSVRMRGFTSRVLEGAVKENETAAETLAFRPVWVERAAPARGEEAQWRRRVVVICEPEQSWRDVLEREVRGLQCIELASSDTRLEKRFEQYATRIFQELQTIVQEKPSQAALIQVVTFARKDQGPFRALAGMLRTVSLENPKVRGQVLELDRESDLLQAVVENSRCPEEAQVRSQGGRRSVLSWEEYPRSGDVPLVPWKENGVYLITGGAGGLGMIFAREIAESVRHATVVLAGRSVLSESRKRKLKDVESLGARVEYRQVDVAQEQAVAALVAEIRAAFGGLDGVIHAAGVIKDQFILRKSVEEFREVLGSKVAGAVNLERATRGQKLDFVVLFSSLSGVMGNLGQADYSAANAFLDAFAEYQNGIAGGGQGRFYSINWPLWKDGGMRIDGEIEKRLEQDMGVTAMSTAAGMQAFCRALNIGQTQTMVVSGIGSRIRKALWEATVPPPQMEQAPPDADASLRERTLAYLKQIVCGTLKVDAQQVNAQQGLEKYGLDSILVLEINKKLEKQFPNLSKTLFFEYGTLNELTDYFVESHAKTLSRVLAKDVAPEAKRPTPALKKRPAIAEPATVRHDAVEPVELDLDEIIRAAGLNNILHSKPSVSREKGRETANSPFQCFAPFPCVRDGFSLSKLLVDPDACLDDARFVIQQQIEMRKVMFFREDLARCQKVLDIGCGTGIDLIELAHINPKLAAHGLTISAEEARNAERIIQDQRLDGRVKIFCEDSTKRRYESSYDLVLSVQVMHFLNGFSSKNELLEKLSGALAADGKILFAEFVGNMKHSMRDAFLDVTVSNVEDWAELLSAHHLVLEEAIDASQEIQNFLEDPNIDRHLVGLEEARRTALKKYNQQVASLREGWVSYCLFNAKRADSRRPVEELKGINLERMRNRTPYGQACREMQKAEGSISYQPKLNRILEIFHLAAPDDARPIVVHESELKSNPEAAAWIAEIDAKQPPTGYERSLYPHFFITADRTRYFRLLIDEPGEAIMPLLPVEKDSYADLCRYAEEKRLRVLLVDQFHEWADRDRLRLVPLGVWQDLDIAKFTLQGGRMRKARYLVEKFKNSGRVRSEEYDPLAELPLQEMREIMIRWSEGKGNIIHHTFECMRDLLERKLPGAHRAFLTYHNDSLCSVIVLGEGEGGRYVMDQEFYDPARAPLGHMEYAIVAIIEQLQKEGVKLFSLGLTWYPFDFEGDPRNDSEGWAWLREQNDRQTLLSRIFEQGRTNHQFKKKFGGVEQPIYAYVPKGAPWSLIMKYWPVFYQNSLTVPRLEEEISRILLAGPREKRAEMLAGGRKLDTLDYFGSSLDLISDSWHSARSAAIREHIAEIGARPQPASYEFLKEIFPFRHLILVGMGRVAESLFYRAFPKLKTKILTTIPWTTTLRYQLENGFEVVERPHTSALSLSEYRFKGEMDLEGLEEALDDDQVAMAGLELLSNGSGGHPIRLAHVQELRRLLARRGVPLVMDASRIVRNAHLLKQHEEPCRSLDIWEIVRRLAEQADHVVMSLTKDFTAWRGGLIATNDDRLAEEIGKLQPEAERALKREVEDVVLRAVSDRERILELVARQLAFTERLNGMLVVAGVPLLRPACGHAVVLDASPFAKEKTNGNRKKALLEDLFIETGIRGSAHQVGKQRNTLLDQCVRLAIPLGLSKQDEDLIYGKLEGYFQTRVGLKRG